MPGKGMTMESTGVSMYGRSLGGELRAAMGRAGAYGTMYPPDYHAQLLRKYTEKGVRYPHILMVLGKPRINHHFFYPALQKRAGKLLDYGCGTGDNVRQLIRDGYRKERITAFDIEPDSIGLGFDLYLDRGALEDLFVVSEKFPFEKRKFDTVYSASVLHVIADENEFTKYLSNACSALGPGGVFFGSTLGLKEGIPAGSAGLRGPPRIMAPEELAGHLTAAGFIRPRIIRRHGVPAYVPGSEELCSLEFCTGT